jgi:hypothetical protein
LQHFVIIPFNRVCIYFTIYRRKSHEASLNIEVKLKFHLTSPENYLF